MIPSALKLLPPARPLKPPTWSAVPKYAYSLGELVCEICALAGYAPDAEQAFMLDGTFGVADNGKSAAFEIDVIAARRALKTGYVVQAILGWAFVTHEPKIMYTAHDLQAAQETWETVAALIESTPSLAAQLQPTRGDRPGIVEGNGRWAIILRAIPERGIPRRRMIFKTRGKSTGRALAGNKLVIDEAFAATARQVGSVLPILGAERDPQVIFASSAGMTDSHVLIDARDRGRSGGSARQLYAEWGDKRAGEGCAAGKDCEHEKSAQGCALDDEDRWAEIIPTLDGRVQRETIRALRQVMPPPEFAREFMVWWDIEGKIGGDIDFPKWLKLGRRGAKQPSRAIVAIDVEPKRTSSSLGIAADGLKGKTLVMSKTAEGTAWVIPALQKLIAKRDIVEVVLHPGGQAGALIPDLIKAGIEYETITSVEMGQGCAAFQNAVDDGTVEHVEQPELDGAVENATVRMLAGGETEQWDRRDPKINISPVVAVSEAHFRWTKQADYDVADSYL